MVNKMKLMGSSDNSVVGEMYVLLNKDLRTIQKNYPVIESVTVNFDEEIFKVDPPRSTD